ncbi:MAG: DUF4249 domain-containing protein [Bacteroidales bacterium]|jgi:hypothetical protein|nr:DUF4249 domain-containing protein [Bacteroidales bacterium]
MKTIRKISVIQLAIAFCFVSCDGFIKDIDIDIANFPPKLSVTAILDRNDDDGKSTFTITLNEARSMADYIAGIPHIRRIVAPGTITLFEDDNVIFTHEGNFDMSINRWSSNTGYRYEHSNFVTHTGKNYRIEVRVDGYPVAASVAVMPVLSAISATVDTTEVITIDERRIHTLDGGFYGRPFQNRKITYDPNYPRMRSFCSVTLQLDNRSANAAYYALELLGNGEIIPVFIRDLSYFPDNPQVEHYNRTAGGLLGMLGGNFTPEMFSFSLFLMNDNNFLHGNQATLNLFNSFPFHGSWYMNPETGEYEFNRNYELKLRIRHISYETFRCYRSMYLQNHGMGFFDEPVNVVGNIHGGYGIFSVYNTKAVLLCNVDEATF